MDFAGFAALAVAVLAVVLVVRGWDVRLVLISAALVMAAAAGDVAPVVRQFLTTFSNEKFVVPICSAMGFAYVLRYTGCERHLVLLLVKPLRRARWLLIPGIIAVGFLVNIPVISQTSTAVCIGPVVVPLMRAAGYSMPTIGACLLLGVSVGGELLNPGAPELLTVFTATGVSTIEQSHSYLPPLVFTQLVVSMLVFWVMSRWWERGAAASSPSPLAGEGSERSERVRGEASLSGTVAPSPGGETPPPSPAGGSGGEKPPELKRGEGENPERINLLKAFVPLVPIVLLFASGLPEPYKVFDVPQRWLVPHPPEAASAAVAGFPATVSAEAKKHPSYSSRLIGLAMLVGVAVAMAVVPSKARGGVKEFFTGAGYGFANVVSLIVAATCFGAGIKEAGLAQALGQIITGSPGLMQPLAAFVPLSFAAVSGSGMASTQSLYGFFHGPAVALGLDAVDVGALVSLGSAAGRTMSPVAAVTLMCATLTGTNPFTLAKRVALPLLSGMVVVVTLRMCGVL